MCYPAEFGRSRSNSTRRSAWKWPGVPTFEVIRGNRHGSIRHLHVWLTPNSIATMGLSRTVSEINGDFSRKSHFFHPVYLTTGWRGFPWNWVSELGSKKLEWWCYRAEKEVWRHLQPVGYGTPTWQTDRRTSYDNTDHAYT